MLVIVKCEKCGHKNAELLPLEISEEDWRRTREKYGEMITERMG
jgi:hypothetical protein